jgi:hypothetical protein
MKRKLQLSELGIIERVFLDELKEIFPNVDFKEVRRKSYEEFYVNHDIEVEITLESLEKLTRYNNIKINIEYINFN